MTQNYDVGVFQICIDEPRIHDTPDVGVAIRTPVGSFWLCVDADGHYHLNHDSLPAERNEEASVLADGQVEWAGDDR